MVHPVLGPLPSRLRTPRRRGVLIVDIAGYGSRTRQQQVEARHRMYRAVREALRRIGVRWVPRPGEDLGDGLRVVLSEAVRPSLLAHPLPVELAAAVERQNRHGRDRLRLRAVVTSGDVSYDGTCALGPDVIESFRLVDAPQLKRVLACSAGSVALIVPDRFYEEYVRGRGDTRWEAYRRVRVQTKEGARVGWITLPGDDGPTAGLAMVGAGPWFSRHRAMVAAAVGTAVVSGLVLSVGDQLRSTGQGVEPPGAVTGVRPPVVLHGRPVAGNPLDAW